MADVELKHSRIAGIAACVPQQIDRIENYALMTAAECESFMKTVGVHERRVVSKGVVTSDLCAAAARTLMQKLDWAPESIDALVFVTQTSDYVIPSTSIILQHRLGLRNGCMAFDMNLGCSGYVVGLQVASSLIHPTGIRRVIFLAGDVSSINMSYHDKSTYPLFGDAGSATAIEYCEQENPVFFSAESDGKEFDALYVKAGGTRHMATPASFEYKEYPGGIKRNDTQMILDGLRVFNFSITRVPPQIENVLQHAGASVESTDFFFLHQANRIMVETIRKKLRIPVEKCPYSIDVFGNTSSASVPLTMCHTQGNETEKSSVRLCLSGFGIGLSWATAWMQLRDTLILPVIEYHD